LFGEAGLWYYPAQTGGARRRPAPEEAIRDRADSLGDGAVETSNLLDGYGVRHPSRLPHDRRARIPTTDSLRSLYGAGTALPLDARETPDDRAAT
jgi:hypothetical protein